MKASPAQVRRRNRLWRENPHCCFCGVKTVMVNGVTPQPDNGATLEHLRPKRWDGTRSGSAGHISTVLCCVKCNRDRNVMVQLLEKYRADGFETARRLPTLRWESLIRPFIQRPSGKVAAV